MESWGREWEEPMLEWGERGTGDKEVCLCLLDRNMVYEEGFWCGSVRVWSADGSRTEEKE